MSRTDGKLIQNIVGSWMCHTHTVIRHTHILYAVYRFLKHRKLFLPLSTNNLISYPAAVMVTSAPTPPHSANVFQRDRGGATKFIYPDPPMTLPLQSANAANPGNNLNAAAVPRDKVTSPNPIIDSVKSYDSDKTLSGVY